MGARHAAGLFLCLVRRVKGAAYQLPVFGAHLWTVSFLTPGPGECGNHPPADSKAFAPIECSNQIVIGRSAGRNVDQAGLSADFFLPPEPVSEDFDSVDLLVSVLLADFAGLPDLPA